MTTHIKIKLEKNQYVKPIKSMLHLKLWQYIQIKILYAITSQVNVIKAVNGIVL